MSEETILILADAKDPQVQFLFKRLQGVKIVAANSAGELTEEAKEATAIFQWSGSKELLQQAFAACPKLKWIHSRSAGLEQTLFPELRDSTVPLTNGTGVFSPALAEFVLGAIFYFAKDFRRLIRNQITGRWEQFDVDTAAGSTVGIVGYGDIGRAVAARAKAMGMNVLALKRHPDKRKEGDVADEIFGPNQRIEMISKCDYIAVTAPLTPETRGLIGETEIAAMKHSAVVINVGRGAVLDEKALIRALRNGKIRGAALDVFEEEPLPAGHPFYAMQNVLLSPHSTDHTRDWLNNSMEFFAEQCERFLDGKPLLNIVDKQLGY
ncbi:MAG: D-2-hydroxyacid dehydrogenase [Acidobacteria bacterium]|nr:D-2-hydroxyacid dehydrogenase [Acidobacteriota bacterium]MBS1865173.1 D-2-hydroxyacid dehydrogenase [Acidobacteriota bacterium]